MLDEGSLLGRLPTFGSEPWAHCRIQKALSAHRGLQGVWPCCGKMVSTLSFPAAMCLQGRLCGHATSWWGHWHCALSEPSLQFSSLNSRISSLCRNILGQACNDSLSTTVGVISLGQWRGRRLLAALLSYDFLRTPDKARPWGGGKRAVIMGLWLCRVGAAASPRQLLSTSPAGSLGCCFLQPAPVCRENVVKRSIT